jgi:hypothetical protein
MIAEQSDLLSMMISRTRGESRRGSEGSTADCTAGEDRAEPISDGMMADHSTGWARILPSMMST